MIKNKMKPPFVPWLIFEKPIVFLILLVISIAGLKYCEMKNSNSESSVKTTE